MSQCVCLLRKSKTMKPRSLKLCMHSKKTPRQCKSENWVYGLIKTPLLKIINGLISFTSRGEIVDSLTSAVIFMSLLAVSQRSTDVWVEPGESWIHWIMGCGAAGTCVGGQKSESSGPWCLQSCSMDVRLGLWPRIWDGHLIPLGPGLFGESLAIAGRTLCPTSGCWERLKWDLLPA